MLLLFGTSVTQVGEYKSRDRGSDGMKRFLATTAPENLFTRKQHRKHFFSIHSIPEKNEKLDRSKFQIRKIVGRLRSKRRYALSNASQARTTGNMNIQHGPVNVNSCTRFFRSTLFEFRLSKPKQNCNTDRFQSFPINRMFLDT